MDNAGNLYVSDSNNCRILQISPPFTTDKAANFAIGQPNLTTNTCPGVGGFYYPVGLAFDRNGNLWVADNVVSSQVLKFDANSLTAANAASATPSQVIGTTNCTNTATAGGLCYPSGVAFDSSGNLWVSDTNNHRVLMFPSGNLVTGATPTFVLGQTVTSGSGVRYCNQSAGGSPASASTLCRPSGIAFDSSGNLWVADSSNNRVLKYAKADLDSAISSQTNDVAATLEVGQPAGSGAFTSNTPNNGGIGPSTLAYPLSAGFDNSGRLIVGDGANNRILFFPSPFSNGMGATLVLGQPNFTTGTPNTPAPNWPPIPGTPSATNLSLEPIG
jgi:sugar lactone lactonase YvrE